MPTATTIPDYTLTNWGPLTTAFSADAACATLGISMMGFRTALGFGYSAECAVPTVGAACYPSGSQLDAAASAAYNTFGVHPKAAYFSPGLVCPSGWKTVGVAARAADGSISASGIFVAPTLTTAPSSDQAATDSTLGTLFYNPVVNAFTAALDLGETAAACCPSSMTAVTDGVCVSTLPDYRLSTFCERFAPGAEVSTVTTDITLLGVHTTVQLITPINSGLITSTVTTEVPAEQSADLVGVKYIPMVMLVRKANDAAGTGGDGGGAGPSPSKTNAASPGRMGSGDGGVPLVAVMACVSALLMGSAWILAR
ncbi:hypothetical protein B0T26DRAFT_748021 [Lasiosphaeria miniovina]|uniref:Uncharacterized protein n=1 Tax=Lasiosphaeria miniovina TaxID=1954250 RepID=A0AA40B540_9PEZI|nr:uncharacterized protein B0T26DRAFT_748021 [Lasiosphaeria miniovina]KAK0727712.1 hypothetical protein B0T26DRAFT_748021 [Lasiosphaeria miniovina]